jgi:hypothetical protein
MNKQKAQMQITRKDGMILGKGQFDFSDLRSLHSNLAMLTPKSCSEIRGDFDIVIQVRETGEKA